MSIVTAAPKKKHKVAVELPKKLGFLLDLHRYKVVYGGRGGGKSHSFARALLVLGAGQQLRILCAREIQNSLKDSVHYLLTKCIEELGLKSFYTWNDKGIYGANGTEFLFTGLAAHTVTTIKSFEGVDIVWVEEAQTVSKISWDILVPTIRADNSEIWVSFNPDMASDETYKRFIEKRRPDSVVVEMKYSDNEWFPKTLEEERRYLKAQADAKGEGSIERDDYDNIWEGLPRKLVPGAIFTREMAGMVGEHRIRPTPYDPRFPVHRVWDLGWNDAMAVLFVQRTHPSAVSIINYREVSFMTYAELVEEFKGYRYRFGVDYMPHDAEQHHPTSGSSGKKTMRGLGATVKIIDRTDDEARIKAARGMFPRVYIDDTERNAEMGYLGCARLIECLKHYKRVVPKTTDEPASPKHDQYSHGADAFGGLAEIVDQIRNEFERKAPPSVPRFKSSVRGAGFLG